MMISQLRRAIMATVDDVASESEVTSPSVLLSKRLLGVSSFTHTPCYCEENVYLLCEKLCKVGVADPVGTDLFVVFISNEKKMVPLWHQKASKRSDGLVLWDYHVICIQKRRGEACDLVWDLDSDLPFPSPLTVYLPEAIKPVNSPYCRIFRVVHAPRFLRCFASDRSHMRDGLGNWLALPPTYEPITSEDGTTNNLDKYIRMRAADASTNAQDSLRGVLSNEYGVVVSETLLEWLFARMHQRQLL